MNVNNALDLFYTLDEEESDGGEVSGLSDVSWIGSDSDSSSENEPEPPRKVRPTRPSLEDWSPDEGKHE